MGWGLGQLGTRIRAERTRPTSSEEEESSLSATCFERGPGRGFLTGRGATAVVRLEPGKDSTACLELESTRGRLADQVVATVRAGAEFS